MIWLPIGIAIGVCLTIPLVYLTAKRTERRVRQLEYRARAAERLAELGTMTGGLAHEIKNPLSTVGLNIQLLQEDVEQLEKAVENDHVLIDIAGRLRRRLSSLGTQTHRLKEILEDFLQFAGRIKLHREPYDLNDLISELIDFFRPQAQIADIQLRSQLAASPALAYVDQGLFKQAILNLLINANAAMAQAKRQNIPHGGADELLLRTENDGNDLVIHIIDTGPGISPDTLKNIFTPYFSTTRGGTGLGLPTTRRMVEEHSGSITCHSDLGRGTEFTIRIPRDPHPSHNPPSSENPS